MGFKDFRVRAAFRVFFIGLSMAGFTYMLQRPGMWVTAVIIGVIVVLQLLDLYQFISHTNRKLTRFMESIKYSDFISGFSSDNKLGKSFKDLNKAFNEVLEAFRKARSEKEEHWQYLNTVVEHVKTGLLSFDEEGNISLMNASASQFLHGPKLRNLEELIERKPRLYKALFDLPPGKSTLYKEGNNLQLSINATQINLQGRKFKLVGLQNIQTELQSKELEAWQNLTRVLRHEIMNSITPIASLSSTMKDILVEDLNKENSHYELNEETVDDLQEGLDTIEDRSQGLIKFIDAYRDYTTIPSPKVKRIKLKDLLDHVALLMKVQLRKARVNFVCETTPPSLEFVADEEQIGQVLINLVKNGIEAVTATDSPKIELLGKMDDENNVVIVVRDNGQGIIREALEKIFIPFFSTKEGGSGIGLSLSRQIMQMHHGTLDVESEPHEHTTFTLKF